MAPQAYLDTMDEAAEFGDLNNCAVVAVAIITGVPYATAHEALIANGRVFREGTYFHTTKAALRDLGFGVKSWNLDKTCKLLDSYPNYRVSKLTLGQTRTFKKQWENFGPLLLRTRGHISAFLNGEVQGSLCAPRKRIYEILDVYKL